MTAGSAPGASRRARLVLIAAGLVWLLHPLLTPVHVEGFSASIQSIAMHMAGGDTRNYDAAFPFNLEFFATSRIGMNLLLAGIYRIAPGAGEWPMRLIMWISLAGLFVASVWLVCRWTGVSRLAAVGVLVLMPGVAESAFFYNDNVLSAALATASIALVLGRDVAARRQWPIVVGGLAFGAAVLVRADAVLLGPAILLCVLGQEGMRLRAVALLAVFGLAAGMLGILVPAMLGFNFLDTLRAAGHAVALWERGPSLRAHGDAVLLFIGLPGAMLAVAGLAVLARRRAWTEGLMLAGVPLVYNLIYLGKLWEVRQVLPLAPFLGALVALGAAWVVKAASRPLMRGVALGLLVFVLVMPAWPVRMKDGPRVLVGRLWTPVLWNGWQARVRADFDRLQALVRGLHQDALLVTDDWNVDRYLHLGLQVAGFEVAAAPASAGQDCGETVEVFRRGGVTVRHLRLHTPFIQGWDRLAPVYLERYRTACGSAVLPGGVHYLTWSDRMTRFGPAPGSPPRDVAPALIWLRRLHMTPIDVQALDASRGLAALQATLTEGARGKDSPEEFAARTGSMLERVRRGLAPQLDLY